MAGVLTPLVPLLTSPELAIQKQAVQVIWGLANGTDKPMAIISAGSLLQPT